MSIHVPSCTFARLAATASFAPALLCLAAPAAAADHIVTITGNFSPSTLTINVGDTVTFNNVGGGYHNVDADDGSFRCARGCDGAGGDGSPSRDNWSATVTFDVPGRIRYVCDAHASMVGWIDVEDPSSNAFNPAQRGLSGSWANAATDSQGILLTVWPNGSDPQRAALFGGWFTFDANPAGGQRWYTLQGGLARGEDSATMPIYRTVGGAFDSGQPTSTSAVGEVVVRFEDCMRGSLRYAFSDGSGRSGTIPLARLLPNVTCSSDGTNTGGGAYLRSGAWADTSNSGQGLVMDLNPPQGVFFAAWYTFFADAGQDAGDSGQHWYTLQAAMPANSSALEHVGIFESTGGVFDQHATTITTQVGSADITWHDCASATMTYTFSAGPNAGIGGTLDLSRLDPVPPGCSL